MKKLAAKRLLNGCTVAIALSVGSHAGAQNVLIGTPDEAHAFDDAAPFVFSGQSLTVDTSFATDRPVSLGTRAQVFVGEGVRFELNGPVSALAKPLVAPLEKRGAGTLVLRGLNTHTSNTVLREGALRIGGASPFGHGINSFEQHAGTVLEFEPGTRILNFIQASATRPGDVPLPGLEGVVEWRVDEGVATVVNNVNALVNLRKTGDGVLHVPSTIQGMNTLHIDGGAVMLDGIMSGRVEVGDGGRLEGGGQFMSGLVARGGTLAPAGLDGVGTLESRGDMAFEADSLYHVNAHPDGRADMLKVVGRATLDGRVWAEAGIGEWLPEHRYTILVAEGGLHDTRFAGADANLAFLDPSLEYDANHVYLALRRNDLKPGDVGDTPDEQKVGDVIDPPGPEDPPAPPVVPEPPQPPVVPEPPAEPPQPPVVPEPPVEPPQPPVVPQPPVEPPQPPVAPEQPKPEPPSAAPEDPKQEQPSAGPQPPVSAGHGQPAGPPATVIAESQPAPLTPLQQAMLSMSREQARTALRQLTGSWHASVRSALIEDSRYVRQAVLASAQELDRGPVRGLRAWAQPYAAAGRRTSVAGLAGDRHISRGLVLGLDTPAGPHWRLGGVLAARHATLERSGGPAQARAHASVDSLDAGVVAHGRGPGLRVTLGLLRAWHKFNSERRVSAGPLQNLLSASYTGRSWQAFMEIAPRLRGWGEWVGLRMAPWLQHAWVRVNVPGFHETGGVAAHRVHSSVTRMHATTLGWRLRRDAEWRGRDFGLQADIGWRHVWGRPQVFSTQHFVSHESGVPGGPAAFTSQGQPLRPHALALGLAIDAEPWRNARVSARYGGLYGRGLRDHAAWAELRWTF